MNLIISFFKTPKFIRLLYPNSNKLNSYTTFNNPNNYNNHLIQNNKKSIFSTLTSINSLIKNNLFLNSSINNSSSPTLLSYSNLSFNKKILKHEIISCISKYLLNYPISYNPKLSPFLNPITSINSFNPILSNSSILSSSSYNYSTISSSHISSLYLNPTSSNLSHILKSYLNNSIIHNYLKHFSLFINNSYLSRSPNSLLSLSNLNISNPLSYLTSYSSILHSHLFNLYKKNPSSSHKSTPKPLSLSTNYSSIISTPISISTYLLNSLQKSLLINSSYPLNNSSSIIPSSSTNNTNPFINPKNFSSQSLSNYYAQSINQSSINNLTTSSTSYSSNLSQSLNSTIFNPSTLNNSLDFDFIYLKIKSLILEELSIRCGDFINH